MFVYLSLILRKKTQCSNLFKKREIIKSEEDELAELRKNLTEAIDENIKIAEEDIQNIKTLLLQNKSYQTDFFNSLYNSSIYISIFDMDVSILTEKFILSKRDYEKKLFARILALTIIEFLDDINPLIGRDLSKQLRDLKQEKFVIPVREISKKFAKYKNENEQYLRIVRNNTIAHKNTDALELHKFINEIESEEIYNLAIELKKLSTEFNKLSTKIIYSIIDFMKKSINKRKKNHD